MGASGSDPRGDPTIRDPVLGPIALCVASFLPFSITYYLNGHHFIEQQLRGAGVQLRKNDNAFLW